MHAHGSSIRGLVVGAVFAGALSIPAGAIEVEGLPGAGFEPGKLNLKLIVHERSGVAREGAAVTSGVPFPVGFLPGVDRLRVLDKNGNAVPSQTVRMIKWHKPVYDDSVQWALVSFLCSVPANGTATYMLVDDGGRSPGTGLSLAPMGNDLVVNTGPATFTVPRKGNTLISRAALGAREIIGGSGLKAVVRTGKWPLRSLEAGSRHTATHKDVAIEEQGPVRVVLAIKGQYAPGDSGGRFYGFTTRLTFEAGSPAVRIIHTIHNGRLDPAFREETYAVKDRKTGQVREVTANSRWAYVWPIEDASLVADLSVGSQATVGMLAGGQEAEWATGRETITAYQDSSGTDAWQKLSGGNYERWLARYTQGKQIRGVTFRGYRTTQGAKRLAAGNVHDGVMRVSGEKAWLTVALRNFREEYPSALGASRNHLRIGLFPGEFSEPFHLNMGARESWDVRLWLGKGVLNMKDCHGIQDALLLFRSDPAWMVRAALDGAWPAGLPFGYKPRRAVQPRWDRNKLDGIKLGWDWYGWISGWNSGGGHWNQSTCFANWVLWGDGANFDSAEAKALWAADVCAMHYDDPPIANLWLLLRSWNLRENRLKVQTYPGYYSRDTWGLPDSGHMGMFMWPEYYLLTGDARCREAWEHLGIRGRAFLWAHNHDDRNDGTGPLRRGVNWCKKKDADADPSFRLATRYVGWPLYDLSQYYRLTGNPQLLAEARNVARSFRNTARYSPIGFMVTQINKKGDAGVYGGQGPFAEGRAESASQCYAHFQQGIMATGLMEYYIMSRDMEALDAAVAFADQTCRYSMLHHADGRPAGWTYTFGDYWGPYSLEQAGGRSGFFVSNFRIIQPLGWIYRYTGRKDYRKVLEAAFNEPRRGGFNTGVVAGQMALKHPKKDGTPPAAIGDLKAEALGDGKVRLSWTATGDDGTEGRVAFYHVKSATATIVERVKGWPDRTPPLPTNKAEWEAKAEAFKAKQLAFWAASTVTAAPEPGTAGTKQEMLIEGLEPGARYFGIKTWDDADNMSPMSNVAWVDVK